MKPFRVYLAATFSTKRDAIIRASQLRSLGIDITSTWLDSTVDRDPLDDPEACEASALGCHRDVESSDALVLDVSPRVSCGKYVELGIAAALGKRVVIVGNAPTVFRHHPCVVARFETWDACVEWLREQLR